MKNHELIARQLPTPMAGLALGIAGLGWSWENVTDFQGYTHSISAIFAALILIALSFKFLRYPTLLYQEITHPVLGSIIPTFAMATMIIAHALSLHDWTLGVSLWLCGIILHVTAFITFSLARLRHFRLDHMLPSWFIPPVGIIVACVSFPGGQFLLLTKSLLYFGLFSYFIILPIMFYRLIFGNSIPEASQPTIAILAAPASLSLAGYLSITTHPSYLFVALLASIAVLMTAIIYLAMFKLLRLAFTPSFSALTFPLAIGATALFKTAHCLQQFGNIATYIYYLAYIELIVASIIVIYVIYCYVKNSRKSLTTHFC